MNFLTAAYTDIGARKDINQDSVLVIEASTDRGQVLLASVCDGMGGLSKGEAASASMVNALGKWFIHAFPALLYKGFEERELWEEWDSLVAGTNRVIGEYGLSHRTELGTTCTAVLACGNDYYTLNVGDSRIYLLSDSIRQLTKDQTYVQWEMDAGHMTEEEALTDPRRNVLMQCIGASHVVRPVFGHGKMCPGLVFMLCSDGFCHAATQEEFYQAFHPEAMTGRAVMEQRMKDLVDLNMARGEDDNISVILIKTY